MTLNVNYHLNKSYLNSVGIDSTPSNQKEPYPSLPTDDAAARTPLSREEIIQRSVELELLTIEGGPGRLALESSLTPLSQTELVRLVDLLFSKIDVHGRSFYLVDFLCSMQKLVREGEQMVLTGSSANWVLGVPYHQERWEGWGLGSRQISGQRADLLERRKLDIDIHHKMQSLESGRKVECRKNVLQFFMSLSSSGITADEAEDRFLKFPMEYISSGGNNYLMSRFGNAPGPGIDFMHEGSLTTHQLFGRDSLFIPLGPLMCLLTSAQWSSHLDAIKVAADEASRNEAIRIFCATCSQEIAITPNGGVCNGVLSILHRPMKLLYIPELKWVRGSYLRNWVNCLSSGHTTRQAGAQLRVLQVYLDSMGALLTEAWRRDGSGSVSEADMVFKELVDSVVNHHDGDIQQAFLWILNFASVNANPKLNEGLLRKFFENKNAFTGQLYGLLLLIEKILEKNLGTLPLVRLVVKLAALSAMGASQSDFTFVEHCFDRKAKIAFQLNLNEGCWLLPIHAREMFSGKLIQEWAEASQGIEEELDALWQTLTLDLAFEPMQARREMEKASEEDRDAYYLFASALMSNEHSLLARMGCRAMITLAFADSAKMEKLVAYRSNASFRKLIDSELQHLFNRESVERTAGELIDVLVNVAGAERLVLDIVRRQPLAARVELGKLVIGKIAAHSPKTAFALLSRLESDFSMEDYLLQCRTIFRAALANGMALSVSKEIFDSYRRYAFETSLPIEDLFALDAFARQIGMPGEAWNVLKGAKEKRVSETWRGIQNQLVAEKKFDAAVALLNLYEVQRITRSIEGRDVCLELIRALVLNHQSDEKVLEKVNLKALNASQKGKMTEIDYLKRVHQMEQEIEEKRYEDALTSFEVCFAQRREGEQELRRTAFKLLIALTKEEYAAAVNQIQKLLLRKPYDQYFEGFENEVPEFIISCMQLLVRTKQAHMELINYLLPRAFATSHILGGALASQIVDMLSLIDGSTEIQRVITSKAGKKGVAKAQVQVNLELVLANKSALMTALRNKPSELNTFLMFLNRHHRGKDYTIAEIEDILASCAAATEPSVLTSLLDNLIKVPQLPPDKKSALVGQIYRLLRIAKVDVLFIERWLSAIDKMKGSHQAPELLLLAEQLSNENQIEASSKVLSRVVASDRNAYGEDYARVRLDHAKHMTYDEVKSFINEPALASYRPGIVSAVIMSALKRANNASEIRQLLHLAGITADQKQLLFIKALTIRDLKKQAFEILLQDTLLSSEQHRSFWNSYQEEMIQSGMDVKNLFEYLKRLFPAESDTKAMSDGCVRLITKLAFTKVHEEQAKWSVEIYAYAQQHGFAQDLLSPLKAKVAKMPFSEAVTFIQNSVFAGERSSLLICIAETFLSQKDKSKEIKQVLDMIGVCDLPENLKVKILNIGLQSKEHVQTAFMLLFSSEEISLQEKQKLWNEHFSFFLTTKIPKRELLSICEMLFIDTIGQSASQESFDQIVNMASAFSQCVDEDKQFLAFYFPFCAKLCNSLRSLAENPPLRLPVATTIAKIIAQLLSRCDTVPFDAPHSQESGEKLWTDMRCNFKLISDSIPAAPCLPLVQQLLRLSFTDGEMLLFSHTRELGNNPEVADKNRLRECVCTWVREKIKRSLSETEQDAKQSAFSEALVFLAVSHINALFEGHLEELAHLYAEMLAHEYASRVELANTPEARVFLKMNVLPSLHLMVVTQLLNGVNPHSLDIETHIEVLCQYSEHLVHVLRQPALHLSSMRTRVILYECLLDDYLKRVSSFIDVLTVPQVAMLQKRAEHLFLTILLNEMPQLTDAAFYDLAERAEIYCMRGMSCGLIPEHSLSVFLCFHARIFAGSERVSFMLHSAYESLSEEQKKQHVKELRAIPIVNKAAKAHWMVQLLRRDYSPFERKDREPLFREITMSFAEEMKEFPERRIALLEELFYSLFIPHDLDAGCVLTRDKCRFFFDDLKTAVKYCNWIANRLMQGAESLNPHNLAILQKLYSLMVFACATMYETSQEILPLYLPFEVHATKILEQMKIKQFDQVSLVNLFNHEMTWWETFKNLSISIGMENIRIEWIPAFSCAAARCLPRLEAAATIRGFIKKGIEMKFFTSKSGAAEKKLIELIKKCEALEKGIEPKKSLPEPKRGGRGKKKK